MPPFAGNRSASVGSCPVWRPGGGAGGDGGAIETVSIECPEDIRPGDELWVETGLAMGEIKVIVPDDVFPGDTFEVRLDGDTREKVDSKETLPEWFFPWPEDTVRPDWGKAALLLIDFQNYLGNPDVGLIKTMREDPAVDPEWELYYVPRVIKVVENTKKLLHAFRMLGHEVIYTRHGPLLPDGRDMIPRRQKRDGFDDAWVEAGDHAAAEQEERGAAAAAGQLHLKGKHLFSVGTFEHDILDSLAPQPGELVLNKNSSSVFNSTDADQLLKNLDIDTLVVVGGATDMCVLTSSIDAADRGYNVVVAEDCTCTFNHRNHVQALSVLSRAFAKVSSHEDILAEVVAAHAAAGDDVGAAVAQPGASAGGRTSDPFGNRAKM